MMKKVFIIVACILLITISVLSLLYFFDKQKNIKLEAAVYNIEIENVEKLYNQKDFLYNKVYKKKINDNLLQITLDLIDKLDNKSSVEQTNNQLKSINRIIQTLDLEYDFDFEKVSKSFGSVVKKNKYADTSNLVDKASVEYFKKLKDTVNSINIKSKLEGSTINYIDNIVCLEKYIEYNEIYSAYKNTQESMNIFLEVPNEHASFNDILAWSVNVNLNINKVYKVINEYNENAEMISDYKKCVLNIRQYNSDFYYAMVKGDSNAASLSTTNMAQCMIDYISMQIKIAELEDSVNKIKLKLK